MADRSTDWLQQAIEDLAAAGELQGAGRHEWACFASQQSAEKAVKALHLHLGQEAWGHVVARPLQELPEAASAPAELVERGRVLDSFYIPTRYPNAHPEGPPHQNYGPLQSDQALEYASQIVDFVRVFVFVLCGDTIKRDMTGACS